MAAAYVCVGQSGASSSMMTSLIKFTKLVGYTQLGFLYAYIAFNFCVFCFVHFYYFLHNHTQIQNTAHFGWPDDPLINVSCWKWKQVFDDVNF